MTDPGSEKSGMSLFYTDVKNENADPGDLLISKIDIYGEKIDFFFFAASITKINDSSVPDKKEDESESVPDTNDISK